MLMYQIERIQKSSLIDQIVVATSTNPLDDPIHKLCDDNNISCFRGSEDDVLGRVSALLHHHNAQVHVECYGDSPFADYQIIDQAIGLYLKILMILIIFQIHLPQLFPGHGSLCLSCFYLTRCQSKSKCL